MVSVVINAGLHKPANSADAKVVAGMVGELQRVLRKHGVPVELQATGTACQYRAGGQVLNLRTQHGQLMVRRGGGFETIISVFSKLRMPA